MGVFDLNEKSVVIREPFMGSNLYYIDNFYKNPDAVVNLLNNTPSNLHHPREDIIEYSLNGIYFEDRRHRFNHPEIENVYNYLSSICGQNPSTKDKPVVSNCTRLFVCDFNNYKDNYWYPHMDEGYNAIVFLNKNDDVSGTNIYESIKPDLPKARGEHLDPWRSKENWKLLTTLKPAYNRCILFDGKKFPHGMHLTNDKYFGEEFRLNNAFFFKEES